MSKDFNDVDDKRRSPARNNTQPGDFEFRKNVAIFNRLVSTYFNKRTPTKDTLVHSNYNAFDASSTDKNKHFHITNENVSTRGFFLAKMGASPLWVSSITVEATANTLKPIVQ